MPRRRTGTIRPRTTSGTYEVRVWDRTNRRTLTRTVHGTHDDAQAELARLQLRLSVHPSGDLTTFGELFWAYMAQAERNGRSSETLRGYRSRFVNHLAGPWADRPVRGIARPELAAWFESQNLGRDLLRQCREIMAFTFKRAVLFGLVESNPTDAIRLEAKPKRVSTRPTPAELAKIMRETADVWPGFDLACRVGAVALARRGELAALRRTDFDLQRGTVTIARAVKRGRMEGATKTGETRTVALDAGTLGLVGPHFDRMAERAAPLGLELPADAFVLSTAPNSSVPVDPDTVSGWWARARQRAGLAESGIRLHDLRGFGATRLLAEGESIPDVQKRGGWATPTTPLRLYTDAVPENSRRQADRLADLIEGP